MGLRNTCKLFEEDFMKSFVKGLVHHHPGLFSDNIGTLVQCFFFPVNLEKVPVNNFVKVSVNILHLPVNV